MSDLRLSAQPDHPLAGFFVSQPPSSSHQPNQLVGLPQSSTHKQPSTAPAPRDGDIPRSARPGTTAGCHRRRYGPDRGSPCYRRARTPGGSRATLSTALPAGKLGPDMRGEVGDAGFGVGFVTTARCRGSGRAVSQTRRCTTSVRATPAGYDQSGSSATSSASGGKSDGEAGVKASIRTIVDSLH